MRQIASADPWGALADPTRRAVLTRVAERPRSVAEIARDLPVSRPAVSQHLRVLVDANLVTGRRDGRRRIYQAHPDGLRELRAQLEQFWTHALLNFSMVDEGDQEGADNEHRE